MDTETGDSRIGKSSSTPGLLLCLLFMLPLAAADRMKGEKNGCKGDNRGKAADDMLEVGPMVNFAD
jgi:hypothetical protein